MSQTYEEAASFELRATSVLRLPTLKQANKNLSRSLRVGNLLKTLLKARSFFLTLQPDETGI